MENGEINLIELAQHFSDEDKAREYIEKLRWPDGPVCPHCGEINNAYRLAPTESKKGKHVRPGVWKCAGCRQQFTVTVGTIFEDSHIPLSKWLLAYHLLCSSKKGMSARQLHRMLKVTYRSAWFMAHRIRYTMTQEPLSSKLDGIIEIDETWVGGKLRRGRTAEERRQNQKNKVKTKAPVFSVLQRGGKVQSIHVPKVTAENVKPIIEQMISTDAHVMTDTSTTLKSVLKGRNQKHDQVNHFVYEYARHENGLCITTDAVEGYFGLLKRGINGVYHHVGQQHLRRYLTEFDYRFNSRKQTDSMRTIHALKSTTGKRLKLRDSKPQVN
jgi:transposase-like protein